MAVVWKKILLTGDAAELSSNAPNTIQPDDTASAGSGTEASRDDHEHAIVAAVPVTVGSANAEGNSTSFSRANHVHQREHAKYTNTEARTAAVSDFVYGIGWDGVTTIAPSKNAVYDKIETLGVALSSKVKIESRDLTAVSGDVSYTGIGFQPTILKMFGVIVNATTASWGFADSSRAGSCVIQDQAGNMNREDTKIAYFQTAGGAYQIAIVQSYDADGYTLTWTKVGSPSGTARFRVLALK